MDDQSLARRRLFRVLLAIIVLVGAIGLLVWAIFFKQDAPKDTARTNSPATNEPRDRDDSPPSTGSTESPETKAGSDDAQRDGRDAFSAGPSATQGGQATLADTGPGNVAALFVGASLIGGFGHHLYVRQRRRG